MSHSYVSNLMHCTFSTKERFPFIEPELESRLWPYIGGIARENRIENRIKPLAIGGIADHVHALLSLPATMSFAKAVQLITPPSRAFADEAVDWSLLVVSRPFHGLWMTAHRFPAMNCWAIFKSSASRTPGNTCGWDVLQEVGDPNQTAHANSMYLESVDGSCPQSAFVSLRADDVKIAQHFSAGGIVKTIQESRRDG